MRLNLLFAAFILFVSTTLPAFASFVLNPTVDWRSKTIGDLCEGKSSCTTPTGIVIESFRTDGKNAVMDHTTNDGLGIRSKSYENDEIEAEERLKFTFATPVVLTSLFISDIFANEGSGEFGFYQLDDRDWVQFNAVDFINGSGNKSNGELEIVLNEETASMITFKAPGRIDKMGHEFAVIGVGIKEAPVPSALVLMLVVAGGAGLYWKRLKPRKYSKRLHRSRR